MVTPHGTKRLRAASYLAGEEDVDWSKQTQEKIKDALIALNSHARLPQPGRRGNTSTTRSPQQDSTASMYVAPEAHEFTLKTQDALPGLAYRPPAVQPEPGRVAAITIAVKSLDLKTLQELMISVIAHDHTNVTKFMLQDAVERASQPIDVDCAVAVDVEPFAETTERNVFDLWVKEVRCISREFSERYGDHHASLNDEDNEDAKFAAGDICNFIYRISVHGDEISSAKDKVNALWALVEISEILCESAYLLKLEFEEEFWLTKIMLGIATMMTIEERASACRSQRAEHRSGMIFDLGKRMGFAREDWCGHQMGSKIGRKFYYDTECLLLSAQLQLECRDLKGSKLPRRDAKLFRSMVCSRRG